MHASAEKNKKAALIYVSDQITIIEHSNTHPSDTKNITQNLWQQFEF